MKETVIAVIQGDDPNCRMVFASRSSELERPIVLRQESFSEGVGWFVQSRIEMTRTEMTGLRSVLGKNPANKSVLHSRPRDNAPVLGIHKLSVAS